MVNTQLFRLAGTTQIKKILIQNIDGQSVVCWESIEQTFPGVKQVKNGNAAIPRYINYCPGTVLDVVLSDSTEHPYVGSSAGTSSMIPTVVLATALTVSPADTVACLTDVPFNPRTDLPKNDKLVRGPRITSASVETPVGEICACTLSTGSLTSLSRSNIKVKTTYRTASIRAKESDSKVQMKKLWSSVAQMISSQKAFEAKQEEIKQLQTQALEQQEEMNQLQKQALERQEKIEQLQNQVIYHQEKMKLLQIQNQEEMRQMQIRHHDEAMSQLAVLQSRVQAVLTQTFELHEYPIPRLFIVLPQDPSGWDAVNPFSNKFRLYFLCECGEHTQLANSKTKIPHHIHLAKHEGYEINRPSEFFRQYGPYVLTILKILKLGITVAGVVIPALSHLISPDVIGQSIDSLKKLQVNITSGVDQVIELMDKVTIDEGEAVEYVSVSKGKSAEGVSEQVDTKEALEGADLRELNTFLQGKDGNRVLGNLYRTVTVEGHVKWVCIDHYRENYQETQAEAFRYALDSVGGGSFDENTGLVTVKLQSKGSAEQFYAALGKARSVLELDIDLDFECTKGDLEGLEDALKTSSVSILRLVHQSFQTSIGSKLLFKSEQHDVLFRIMKLPNMKVIHIVLSKEFGRLSDFQPKNPSHLHKLSLEMVVGREENKEVRILAEILKTNSIQITWYLYSNSIGDNGAQALSEAFKTNSNLTTVNMMKSSIGDNEAQALSEALKSNSTLTTLDLTLNKIGDNGALALSEALKTNSVLATLSLKHNKIGLNGAQALSEALKTNSTLTILDLKYNSVGDSGAHALSEALKINSTLITLNLENNSIKGYGAQALSKALMINSTLTALYLERNSIVGYGAQAFSKALKINSTLTTLNLKSNLIGNNGAQALSVALKANLTLTTLSLVHNSIGNKGAQALTKALKINSTLTTLELGMNAIRDNGARALSVALKTNSTLTTLDLEGNSIGDSGAQALSEALKINSTLTTLNLKSNLIGNNGAQALSVALKANLTLTTLSLVHNSFGNKGAQALSDSLKNNSTLTNLDLEGNSIGNNGAQALSEALKTNSTLTILNLTCNPIGPNGVQVLSEGLNSNSIITDLRY